MDQQSESDFFGSVLKIALGIFFGVILVWIAGAWVVRYQLQQASAVIEQSLAEANAKSRAQQRQREARAAAQRLERQRVIDARFVAEDLARARAQHKDQLWQQFFQKSERCLTQTSVECGNEYIRARREFERRYAAGDLNLD